MTNQKGSQQPDKDPGPILSPAERRERNRRETVDAILAVSRDIMRERGVAALNLQEVARRVGMSAPSLYNYFPNMMAIYQEVFARGMRRYRQGAERLAEELGPTAEAYGAILRYYMEFAEENPELFHLLFERPVPGFVPSEAGLEEIGRLIEFSSSLMEEQQAAGVIHPSIPMEHARDLLVATMHGLTSLKMANEPEAPVGEGRFGSLIPLAARALALLYEQGLREQ